MRQRRKTMTYDALQAEAVRLVRQAISEAQADSIVGLRLDLDRLGFVVQVVALEQDVTNKRLNDSVFLGDERGRAKARQAPSDAIASITFDGNESSWGEFLTRNEVAVLHAWLGALIGDTA